MGDRFTPLTMEQLVDWVFDELEWKDSVFGVPRSAFFLPRPGDRFRTAVYGQALDSPLGVAAGPHTQMAQNIVVAWLLGARFIELKTIQTLDELEVAKPCIDVQDEGYNVEWSQELKVYQSFDEYLRAWVLIHALHRRLGFAGERPGVIFNMSVGYDLAGIKRPNVQWYLEAMADGSVYLPGYLEIVARRCPEVREIEVPARLSDSITLSTMHGCPPDEIEQISLYLIEERRLHTAVKCNPTLLGADRVRAIINDDLGFGDVPVPDEAFGHDLRYADAVPMLHNLRRAAAAADVGFGLKLSNTLEVENWRGRFAGEGMMYLSGRALHPVTVTLAATLNEEFRGALPMSFAGGADCFNVADLLASGMTTVTVCSDLLKSGGYLRLPQYLENLDRAMTEAGAVDLSDLAARRAAKTASPDEIASLLEWSALTGSGLHLAPADQQALAAALASASAAPSATTRAWAAEHGWDETRADQLVALVGRVLTRLNLRRYAREVRHDWRYQKDSFRTDASKTDRALDLFDCIEAPCVDECPVNQDVPHYMRAVREGDFGEAVRVTRADNPLPCILGQVCDHLCETTCVRTHLDEPLAIRQVKRFIMEQESGLADLSRPAARAAKVAVIGAGPAGLAAAEELARAGITATIYEQHPYAGGMVGGAIPEYRLPQASIEQDLALLRAMGVEFRFGQTAGVDFSLADLREQGYDAIFVAVGAQLAKRLGLPGEDAHGVTDALRFLRSVREGQPLAVGPHVGVIGAGDTAMDTVRSALRVGAESASLIYRRTIDQMPADREEVHACREEGVRIVELARPVRLHVEDGTLVGLVCTRTTYRGERDPAGRKVPVDVPDSEFEIPLDTLILAISQHALLDFFGVERPALTRAGYLAVDPSTMETSVEGVYAGGDVAGEGPSSIVKAAAEGKAVARAIIANHGGSATSEPRSAAASPPADLPELLRRRARREYRVPVSFTPVSARGGFEQTVLGYTREEAMAEADRCLDCHTICSLCVGVCPNLALLTYELQPSRFVTPMLRLEGGVAAVEGEEVYRTEQALQVAVVTDFCNECGNCVTVCPTAGEPYRDKPRLYLDRAAFEAETANAVMLFDDGTVEARYAGATHQLSIGDVVEYQAPGLRARLEADTLAFLGAEVSEAAVGLISLRPAAEMYALARGLRDSMPQLPRVRRADAHGSKVPHPAYAD